MTVYFTREAWGSRESDPAGSQVGKAYEIIGHHAWKPHVDADTSFQDECEVMRAIQRFHVEDRGWDDIAYSFLVLQSGRGYEGRGWFRSGAHTSGQNDKPAICFVINGDEHEPTDAAWDKAREIIEDGIRVGALDEDYRVTGHHDYSPKSCPGTKVYPLLSKLEGVTVGRKYAQAVVVYSDVDLEHGRVLAQTYDLALCRIGKDARLWSETHPGDEATVDYAFLVGQAATRAGHLPFNNGSTKLAGPDRDATARKVGRFIESHRREDMDRRGVPWS